jgi:hypothetical protein
VEPTLNIQMNRSSMAEELFARNLQATKEHLQIHPVILTTLPPYKATQFP